MFYSQFILAKKGPLGTIWIAAHLERKLRKNQVADTDIGNSVDSILSSDVPIALRLSSHLLLGVVKIYSRKVNYLFDDCSEALLKVKQAFRSAIVDLAPEESKAPYDAITLPETFDLDDFELPESDLFQGNFIDHHVSAREHITLQDTMEGIIYSATKFGLDERFCDGDGAQFGLELEDMLLEEMVVRETDKNMPRADIDLASVRPATPVKEDEINKGMSESSDLMTYNAYRNNQGFFEVIHVVESVGASYDSPAKSFNVSEPSHPNRHVETGSSNPMGIMTDKNNKPDFRPRHCENADGKTSVCKESRPQPQHHSVNAVALQVCAVDGNVSSARPAEVSCSPVPCKPLLETESVPSAMTDRHFPAPQKNDLVGGGDMEGMADIAALIASRYQNLEERRRDGVGLEGDQLEVISDFPKPEMFLSLPHRVTREREAEGVFPQPESGKKRSFTESTVTTAIRASGHNSEESSVPAAESKTTMNPVRDDGDLLSSILSGRQSPVFSVRETPPSWGPPPAKRPRPETRIGPAKRKVLMDDSMILQAETVRKQLISTEDIRRLRKKAPCTVPQIWMLHKLWMEEEVFSDPVCTGMAFELTDLHGGRRSGGSACLDDDVTESSTTVPALDSAPGHFGRSPSAAAPPPVATAATTTTATDRPMSGDLEAAPAAAKEGKHSVGGAVVEMSEEWGERRENHSAVEVRKGSEEEGRHSSSPARARRENEEEQHSPSPAGARRVNEKERHSLSPAGASRENEEERHSPSPAGARKENEEERRSPSPAGVRRENEEERCSPSAAGARREDEVQRCSPSPSGARRENEGERHSPSPAGASGENETGEKAELPPAVGRESDGGSCDLAMREGVGAAGEERCVRALSPVAVDEMAEEERRDLVGDNSHNLSPRASPDRRESGESSEAAAPRSSSSTTAFAGPAGAEEDRSLELLFSLGREESSSTRRIDPTCFRPDPNPIFTSHRHQHHRDPVGTAFDDTDFLRTDSCCMPTPEEEANFNSTGWSGRTRAVAKYLQTVFAKGGDHGGGDVALDTLLSGKTAKEASRMFFETLVLKTRDYVHVKQQKPLGGIRITAQPKLKLAEF